MATLIEETAPAVVERPPGPESLPEPNQVLLKAVKVLRRRGWAQNYLEAQDNKVCVIGAIDIVEDVRDDLGSLYYPSARHPSERVARQAVKMLATSLGWHPSTGRDIDHYVTGWNDTPGRKKREVEEALERAAWGID